MLIVRPAEAADLDDLVALADQLDSVNLPADRDFISERIELLWHCHVQLKIMGINAILVFDLLTDDR